MKDSNSQPMISAGTVSEAIQSIGTSCMRVRLPLGIPQPRYNKQWCMAQVRGERNDMISSTINVMTANPRATKVTIETGGAKRSVAVSADQT